MSALGLGLLALVVTGGAGLSNRPGTCATDPQGKGFYNAVLVLPAHKLAFCWIAKVASHEFRPLFNQINGFPRVMIPEMSALDNQNIPLSSISRENGWKFALFTRDPLERYLSAFKDKCLHPRQKGGAMNCCGPTRANPVSVAEAISLFEERAKFDAKHGVPSGNSHWRSQTMHIATHCDLPGVNWFDADYIGHITRHRTEVNEQVQEMLRRLTSVQNIPGVVAAHFRGGISSRFQHAFDLFYRKNSTVRHVAGLMADDYENRARLHLPPLPDETARGLEVAVLTGQRPVGGKQPSLLTTQDCSACESLESCRMSRLPKPGYGKAGHSRIYMGRLLEAGYAKARAVARAGRRPVVVAVGADYLSNTALWTDRHLYGEVLEKIGVPPGQLRMVFVEPMPEKAAVIWKNMGKLPINRSQVQLVQAVLGGECRAKTQLLYSIAPEAGSDFHFPPQRMEGWTSMSRDRVLTSLRRSALRFQDWPCDLVPSGNCIGGLRAFANAANLSSYLKTRTVPCLTLKEALRSTGSAARDVAMLTVDAEGSDTAIVRPMLDNPAFKPGFIMFEDNGFKKNSAIEKKLRARGYLVGTKTDRPDGLKVDNPNVIAVRGQNFLHLGPLY